MTIVARHTPQVPVEFVEPKSLRGRLAAAEQGPTAAAGVIGNLKSAALPVLDAEALRDS